MVKHATPFQLITHLSLLRADYQIVDWSKNSAGLYIKGFENSFKTHLAASGTRKELEQLVQEHHR